MNSKTLQVGLVGAGGTGKTALVIQFAQNHFVQEYDPTIENSYRKQLTVDGQTLIMDVIDCGGQEEYRAMVPQFLRPAKGFIFVYSIDSRYSFEEIEKAHEQLIKANDVEKLVMVLCGNKSDLDSKREVSTEEGKQLAIKMGGEFFETSAKDRINVDESFIALARTMERDTVCYGPPRISCGIRPVPRCSIN